MNETKKKIWTPERSVTLSLVMSWVVAAGIVFGMVAAPFLVPRWFTFHYAVENTQLVFTSYMRTVIAAFYICCPAGLCCIAALIRLLSDIRKDIVFTPKNVLRLRILSWCCFYVAAVTLAAFFFYPPFILVFAASGFFGLILRVVKNVMAKATELKDENDLTI